MVRVLRLLHVSLFQANFQLAHAVGDNGEIFELNMF